MLIRRFQGETTKEALRKVREAFGPEALVLSTKTLRKGNGWLGVGARPSVEVTAAIDREHLPEGAAAPAPAPVDRGAASATPTASPDASWRPLQLSRAVVEPLEEEIRALRATVQELSERERRERSLGREIAELRRLAHRVAARPESHDPGVDAYLRAGLSLQLANEWGRVVDHRVTVGEPRAEAAIECLASALEPRLLTPRADDPRILMLIGAPGAGKTTTLAKVAGREWGEKPCMITTDVQRWGGVEALRGVASQLEMEVEVALSPEDLADRVRSHRRDRLLIDTPGRSGRDDDGQKELLAQRRAIGEHADVQLVLSATTKECDLAAELDRYSALEPRACVLTKIDDSTELGSALNVLLEPDAPPLAWVASGQRIPEDLAVPDPFEIARRVMEAA